MFKAFSCATVMCQWNAIKNPRQQTLPIKNIPKLSVYMEILEYCREFLNYSCGRYSKLKSIQHLILVSKITPPPPEMILGLISLAPTYEGILDTPTALGEPLSSRNPPSPFEAFGRRWDSQPTARHVARRCYP